MITTEYTERAEYTEEKASHRLAATDLIIIAGLVGATRRLAPEIVVSAFSAVSVVSVVRVSFCSNCPVFRR